MWRRLALVLACVLAGVFGLALPAAAHPTLVATLPEAGYSVTTSPEEIGLVFDERVTVHFLDVEGQARGKIRTSDPELSADGTRVVVRPVDPLPDGAYTVRWQITALDGDIVDGTFGFGVGAAAAPTADPAATQTSGLGAAAVLRWVLLTGLALGLGGLVGDTLARRGARLAGSDHGLVAPRPWLLPGSVLGVVASMGLALHALGGGSLATGLTNLSVATLLDSSSGRLITVQVGAFIVATVAATRPNRRLLAAALGVVVVAHGLGSHLQTQAPPWGSLTIMVHLAAVAIWIGALLHVVRVALAWRHTRRMARGVLIEYALVAVVLYGVVVSTGAIAALLVLPTVDALWSTGYGQVLLAKLALVAVASALALSARRQLHRRLSTPRTVRYARVESAALVTVLAASAVLSAAEPPADPTRGLAYPPPAVGETVRVGTLAGQITTGAIASASQLEIRLRVPEWDPNARHDFTVAGTITRPDAGQASLDLQPCGAGCFVGPAQWGAGTNTVELDVTAKAWRGTTATMEIPWPPRDGQALFEQMLDTMTDQPALTLVESVTSDTSGPAPFRSDDMRMSGAELIDLQPYRSGVINAPTILGGDGDTTEIGFAISAESIYVRQTLDPDGRILNETLVTPNHLIERTYSYR